MKASGFADCVIKAATGAILDKNQNSLAKYLYSGLDLAGPQAGIDVAQADSV